MLIVARSFIRTMDDLFLSRPSISVLVCVRCFAMSHTVDLVAVPLAQPAWGGGRLGVVIVHPYISLIT